LRKTLPKKHYSKKKPSKFHFRTEQCSKEREKSKDKHRSKNRKRKSPEAYVYESQGLFESINVLGSVSNAAQNVASIDADAINELIADFGGSIEGFGAVVEGLKTIFSPESIEKIQATVQSTSDTADAVHGMCTASSSAVEAFIKYGRRTVFFGAVSVALAFGYRGYRSRQRRDYIVCLGCLGLAYVAKPPEYPGVNLFSAMMWLVNQVRPAKKEPEFISQSLSHDSFMALVKSIILGLFAHKLSTDSSRKGVVQLINDFLDGAGRKTEALSDYLYTFFDLCQKILNFIMTKCGYSNFITVIGSTMPEIDSLIAEVSSMATAMDLGTLSANQENFDALMALEQQHNKILKKLPISREGVKIRVILGNVLASINKMRTYFRIRSPASNGARQVPTTVLLNGTPGAGKSEALQMLTTALCARTLPARFREEYSRHPMSFMYVRNPAQVYWDDFNSNKWVCIFDDFAQTRDVVGDKDNEWVELIRCCNPTPFAVHMASLEEKAGSYFKCPFLLASSNMTGKFNVESINSSDAVYRRFDFAFTVVPKDEYSYWKESDDGRAGFKAFDVKKLQYSETGVPIIDEHAFEFHKFCLGGYGTGAGEIWSFDQVVNALVMKYDEKRLVFDQIMLDKQRLYNKWSENSAPLDQPCEFVSQMDDDTESIPESIVPEVLDDHVRTQHEFLLFSSRYYPYEFKYLHAESEKRIEDYSQKLKENTALATSTRIFTNTTAMLSTLSKLHITDSVFLSIEQIDYIAWKMCPDISFWDAMTQTDFQTNPVILLRLMQLDCDEMSRVLNARVVYGTVPMKILRAFSDFKESVQSKLSAYKEANGFNWLQMLLDIVQHPIVRGVLTFFITRGILRWMFTPSSTSDEEIEEEEEEIEPGLSESAHVDGRVPKSKSKTPTINKDHLEKMLTKVSLFRNQMDGENMSMTHDEQIIRHIVLNNCYEFNIEKKDGSFLRSGYAIFVQGRVFMSPCHYPRTFAGRIVNDPSFIKRKIRLVRASSRRRGESLFFEFPVSKFLENGIYLEEESPNNDVYFCALPREYPCHKSIVKHLVPEKLYVPARDWKVKLVRPTADGIDALNGRATTLDFEVHSMNEENNDATILTKGWRYYCATKNGDCGAPVFVTDNRDGDGTLLGFHVSGGTYEPSGICNFVSREIVVKALSRVPDEYKILEDMKLLPAYSNQMESEQFDAGPSAPFLPSRFNPILELKNAPTKRVHTAIARSRLWGTWGPPLTAPAMLNPTLDEHNQIVNPYSNALSKYCTPWVNFDMDLVRSCARSYMEFIFSRANYGVEKRLYTSTEAILGTDDPDFGSIARNTSPGFPIVGNPIFSGKKKFGLLGSDMTYDLETPELKKVLERVDQVEISAKQCIRELHVFTDNLKDERRPLEKVRLGKTRLFSGCPFDYHILVRRYFGAFTLWYHKNRVANGSALGVNPYGEEWHDMALRLRAYGHYSASYGSGDYSGFDGSAKAPVQWAILDIINSWYDDGPENALVRMVLWLELVNSRHVRENLIYGWSASLPSGHPLTSIVNTMYNLIVMRMVWCSLLESHEYPVLHEFEKNVCIFCLGDDNLFAVTRPYRLLFNEANISVKMRDFGLVYTNEQKKGVNSALREFEEVSFLKRKFRYNEDVCKYVAPLDINVIFEIPYWTKNIPNLKETIERDNLQVACDELSLHGRDTFDNCCGGLLYCAKTTMDYVPPRFTYDSCFEFITNRETEY
jgi:hypothetical protein